MTHTGLNVLASRGFDSVRSRRLGVLCNQASIDANLEHILELLPEKPVAVFGPQHGLGGHTQDNMIEWEPGRSERPWRVHSLYGEHRQPTLEMLRGIDLMLIDLQDVGARYYTFIWTMLLTMRACKEAGIKVVVLDRPNPIGGAEVEGTVLEPSFASFVGLEPLPMRHGLTIGEIATLMNPGADLEIVPMQGWTRDTLFAETGQTWALPSPNMPTPDTALVYPGACLLEATNLSEGRGTTRPFEIVGAPFLNGDALSRRLNGLQLPGVKFRSAEFQPTFNKHAGELCRGCFVHVTEARSFRPVLTYIAILQFAIELSRGSFAWKQPPYEYEFEKLPIDILAGNDWLREAIEDIAPLDDIRQRMEEECRAFSPRRAGALLY